MAEVVLSIVNQGAEPREQLRGLLKQFEASSGISVQLYEGEFNRAEIHRIAVSQKGPDVTEIGTTWVNGLVAMNALRSFSEAEIQQVGGADDFVRGAWDTCHIHAQPELWAYPWMAESVMIHYRKDLLAQAGLDPAGAFSSLKSIAQTGEQLARLGLSLPIELPYRTNYFDQLHGLSGWLWSYGGEYISDDRMRVAFDRAESLAAMTDYFTLLHTATDQARVDLLREKEQTFFRQGKSAVMFAYHEYHNDLESFAPDVRDNWGIAMYPAVKYMGGSNLIIWKHCRHEREAVEVVRFLTSPEVELALARQTSMLPGRIAALEHPQITQDPSLAIPAQSVRLGRSYPTIPLWSMIEDRLIRTLEGIQTEVLQNPSASVEEAVRRNILPLAKRLNLTLAG